MNNKTRAIMKPGINSLASLNFDIVQKFKNNVNAHKLYILAFPGMGDRHTVDSLFSETQGTKEK